MMLYHKIKLIVIYNGHMLSSYSGCTSNQHWNLVVPASKLIIWSEQFALKSCCSWWEMNNLQQATAETVINTFSPSQSWTRSTRCTKRWTQWIHASPNVKLWARQSHTWGHRATLLPPPQWSIVGQPMALEVPVVIGVAAAGTTICGPVGASI